jgi:hypothetical protein
VGCSGAASYLGYDNRNIHIQVAENIFKIKGTQVEQKRDSFASLYLIQNIIRSDDGEIIVFEDARTDLDYEFEPMISRSIKIIFEANKIITVYGKGHLYAYQLLLSNGKLLNIIAYQSNTQDLRFIYGMSTEKLNTILRRLDPNAVPAYYKSVITLKDIHNSILSRWDVKKVHFVPLVVPLPRFMGRL